ncbi:uncharacterized protein LOC123512470 isoform X2 [Portunus trituberculatus]|uniref:uncharacterized protein LOC123512470 isoform X2 n=1 Tax=Portunus trituberculatus TaxID=210409 RepID=UPI001E1CF32E|nr:uncharacterized protein LOC123512470 isoform X2 [Portunus trituberculatus]
MPPPPPASCLLPPASCLPPVCLSLRLVMMTSGANLTPAHQPRIFKGSNGFPPLVCSLCRCSHTPRSQTGRRAAVPQQTYVTQGLHSPRPHHGSQLMGSQSTGRGSIHGLSGCRESPAATIVCLEKTQYFSCVLFWILFGFSLVSLFLS